MSKEKIVLVFPEIEEEPKAFVVPKKVTIGKKGERMRPLGLIADLTQRQFDVGQVESWFTGYKVDSIEIWLKGALKSEGVTKLFLSAEGEGGMKITLKPK